VRRRQEAEARVAAALHRGVPGEVDEIGAAATVAVVMAATHAAAIITLGRDGPRKTSGRRHRALEIGLWGHRRNR